ncbi:unnamed protein product [Symbiodinium natans]|uniref:Uncharacterized protein n=1 Tax=Symbiodinium natans TaxID=878477 RepID=A0A812LH47_9DINO|nr:unnamed protein product [Symbiodinium natans]
MLPPVNVSVLQLKRSLRRHIARMKGYSCKAVFVAVLSPAKDWEQSRKIRYRFSAWVHTQGSLQTQTRSPLRSAAQAQSLVIAILVHKLSQPHLGYAPSLV